MKKRVIIIVLLLLGVGLSLLFLVEGSKEGRQLKPIHPVPGFSQEKLLEAMKSAKSRNSASTGDLSDIHWQARGPNHTGGRIRAGMFDPNDASSKRVYAGAISGGLWYTNDITHADSTWYPVDDLFPNLAVSALTYDPNQPQIWYLGTGDGYEGSNAVSGIGAFKSIDGGQNWQLLSSTANAGFYYVNELVVTSLGTVLAATSGSSGGIMRSVDGGQSWATIKSGKYADISMASNGDLYATRGVFGSTIYVYKSTDDGLNWQNITPSGIGNGRAIVTASPSNSAVVYVASGAPGGNGKVYKSVNAGASWVQLTAPEYTDDECSAPEANFAYGIGWHAMMLSVHPQHSDQLILGSFEGFRSLDGGATWSQHTHWRGICHPFVHADHLLALHRPGFPNEVVMFNDGGVFYSPDFGDAAQSSPSFVERNNGLLITQLYRVGFDNRADVDFMVTGAQDNSVLILDAPGVSANRQILMTDGNFGHVDSIDHNFLIFTFPQNLVYKSFDRGVSRVRSAAAKAAAPSEFYSFSLYDSERKIFYMAGQGGKLNRIEDFMLIEKNTVLNLGISGFVTFMRASEYTSDRFFIGTSTGNIYQVDQLSDVPIVVDLTGTLSINQRVTGINIGRADSELLISFLGYGINAIWETENTGVTWLNRQGDLPDMPVRSVIYHPFDQDRAIITTEMGVWATDDLSGSTAWYPINAHGMANVRTDEVHFRKSDSLLILATHGRGVFTSDFLRIPITSSPEILFLSEKKTIREESFDSLRDYREMAFRVHISQPSNGDAIVDLSFSGTAMMGVDYELVSADSLVFRSGDGSPQSVVLSIRNDRSIELDETVIIGLSQRTTTTDAVVNTQKSQLTVTIEDNAERLLSALERIYVQDWDPASSVDFDVWNATFGSYNFWDISTNCGTPTQMVNIVNFGGCGYAGNGSGTNMILYDTIDAVGYQELSVKFDWHFGGNADDYIELIYSLDAINWSSVGGKRFNIQEFQSDTVELPALVYDQVMYVGFRFIENGDAVVDASPAFSMDNFEVWGRKKVGVVSALNSTITEYLGPYDTVLFKDQQEQVIAKIENRSGHDYGLTSIAVDRSGSGAKELWAAGIEYGIGEKTIMINPTTNNPGGEYFLTFFMSQQEADGWLAAVNGNTNSVIRTLNDLTLAKSGGSLVDINPLNPSAHGASNYLAIDNSVEILDDQVLIRGHFFTGFSGIGAGTPEEPPSNSLPVELAFFKGHFNQSVVLEWHTYSEHNNDRFEIERSMDGKEFGLVSSVAGSGNSSQPVSYRFVDDYFLYGLSYYRLNQIDYDGQSEYSEIISVVTPTGEPLIYPNPTSGLVNIRNARSKRFILMDIFGNQVVEGAITGSKGQIDLGHLPKGLYVLKINSETVKIIKR